MMADLSPAIAAELRGDTTTNPAMTTTTTDYRALCAELAESVRYLLDCVADGDSDPVAIAECVQHLGATRAALSQSDPEGLTDEEIADEARKYLVNEYALPAEITYLLDSDNFEYEPTIGCFRAVLARWGRPAIEPVPVSERPWEREGWCDAKGRCALFSQSLIPDCPTWILAPAAWGAKFTHSYTYSLPHYALPLPDPNGQA